MITKSMIMDAISIIGLLVTIAGFAVSIWQIIKTRSAAEAAASASQKSINEVIRIKSITSIEEICGRCRDLMHLTRDKNFKSAANSAFELRDLVSRFSATTHRDGAKNSTSWQNIRDRIKSTHERLESAGMINKMDAKERETILHDISQIHSELSALAGAATEEGVRNANS